MSETQHAGQSSAPVPSNGPDLLTLLAGLAALGLSATTLLGGISWVPGIDGRWVLAGVASIIGLLLVIGSLRPAGAELRRDRT